LENLDDKKSKNLGLLTGCVFLQGMTKADFKKYMGVDKKVQDGKLRLILLKGPLGSCVFTGDFSQDILDETLAAFSSSS
jgi:3-dehydroquinate synthetase